MFSVETNLHWYMFRHRDDTNCLKSSLRSNQSLPWWSVRGDPKALDETLSECCMLLSASKYAYDFCYSICESSGQQKSTRIPQTITALCGARANATSYYPKSISHEILRHHRS